MLVNWTGLNWTIWAYNFAKKIRRLFTLFKGCGMGPLLVLVSPCFRENVVVTCKIRSFLCNLDNLLQKNLMVFFFLKIKFENGAHLKKGLIFYFQHFLVTREKLQKFLQYIFTHIHTCILLTHFFALQILKKKYEFIRYGFSLVLWCWFLFAPFSNNQ